MHPIRGIGAGVTALGLLSIAVIWLVLPAVAEWLSPGGMEPGDFIEVYMIAVVGASMTLPGMQMVIAPGPRIDPFDFEDWLEELGWGQRLSFLASLLASVAISIYVLVPWAELAEIGSEF